MMIFDTVPHLGSNVSFITERFDEKLKGSNNKQSENYGKYSKSADNHDSWIEISATDESKVQLEVSSSVHKTKSNDPSSYRKDKCKHSPTDCIQQRCISSSI